MTNCGHVIITNTLFVNPTLFLIVGLAFVAGGLVGFLLRTKERP